MNIVIPMAGKGERLKAGGFTSPKMLVECEGEPLFSWALKGLHPFFTQPFHLIFICLREHLQTSSVLKQIRDFCPYPCTIFTIDKLTEGQAETVLMAEEYINNNQPLLIFNCDTYIEIGLDSWSPNDTTADGILWTFHSTEPNLSFVKTGVDQTVEEVVEKVPVSTLASTGLYFFRTGKLFVNEAKEAIKRRDRIREEYYIGPLYNELINQGKVVEFQSIKSCFPLGTPEEISRFKVHLKEEGNEVH